MKKLLFLLIATGSISALAQTTDSTIAPRLRHYTPAMEQSPWVVDVNLLGGVLTQDLTRAATANNYLNGVNINEGRLKFSKGTSFGGDAQLGYFLGRGRHWGVGIGLMYLHQSGNTRLDSFHAEYQSTDGAGNIYRQVVTPDHTIKENITITNVNIPLVLKYKTRFSRRWGITADAGLLFNMQMKNSYKTDATFDYEAIYLYSNSSTGYPTYYDNNPVPRTGDFLLTKAHYMAEHPGGDVNAYFVQQREQGFNVGLGVKPNNNSGSVSYASGNVGFLFQPSVSYYLSDNLALNLGFYYLYQNVSNIAQSGYQLTSKMGDYSSSLNSVTKSVNQSYGINAGVRFLFGKPKDTDGDGIPDKKDRCPLVFGLDKFLGCPDTDGDGIPDPDDSCPRVAGLVQFHGCPDSDGDGIQDKDDSCPYQKGLAQFHGCPDTDGDGIPDNEDRCPTKAGLARFHGCPDTDGDGVPDNEDKCPDVAGPVSNNGCPLPEPPKPVVEEPKKKIGLSIEIFFDEAKTTIKKSSYAELDEAAETLKKEPEVYIEVDGYTDNLGTGHFNKVLSQNRASAVKAYLVKKGVSARKIKAIGHGSSSPVATNDTDEGRAKNRRVTIILNQK